MKKTVKGLVWLMILCLVITCSGCVTKKSWTVRHGEHSISAGMYVYQLQQQKSNYLSQNSLTEGNDLWETEYDDTYTIGEYLQATTVQSLVSSIIWRAQFNRLELSFTDEEKQTIEDNIAQMTESSGGEELVRQTLEEYDIGYDEFMESVYYDTQKILKVVEYYFGPNGLEPVAEEEIMAYFKDNYARCKHILISTQDSDGATLTGDDMAKAKAQAQAVYQKAKGADDAAFEALIKEYNDDEGVSAYPDGYVFTLGEMVDEFEKAAFDMEVGETRLVQSDYGFHIMRKLTLEDEKIFTQEIRKKMLMGLKSVELGELFAQWSEEIPVEINTGVLKQYTCTSIGTVEDSALSEEEQLAALAEQLGLEETAE